jgi:predicted aspartyl protease
MGVQPRQAQPYSPPEAPGRMTVPVLVNGQGPFPFVVDTGSNRTILSDTLASQLNLPAGRVLRVHAATGAVSTGSVRVASLSVAKHTLADFDAPVLIRENIGALGMLGIDVLAKQRIELDFLKARMTVSASRFRSEPGAVVVRAKSKYGQLLLIDSSVEGVPIYVIIDTGGEMTIGNSALRDMLAKRRVGFAEKVEVTGVSGDTVVADLSFLPRVRLGQLTVTNQQIAYTDLYVFKQFGLQAKPAMLLGMSTLRHFDRVLIDFPGREVSFAFGSI